MNEHELLKLEVELALAVEDSERAVKMHFKASHLQDDVTGH